MPRPGLIPARSHWCLHNDRLAQEYDAILNLTLTFPGCPKLPEGIVFFAPLISDVNDRGGAPSNYERDSEGTYESAPTLWALASPGAARFEVLGLLMEPAATNKVRNYNANPDAGLTGLELDGDPAVIISRELMPDLIAASGLSAVCTSGYVQQIDSRGAPEANSYMVHDGPNDNTNVHSWSGFARRDPDFSRLTQIRTQNGQNSVVVDSGIEILRRYADIGSNSATNAELALFLTGADHVAQCVLFGVVEETILSSPIITQGAAGLRSADLLNYGNADSFFPQAQGMVIIDWSPKFTPAQVPAQHAIVGLRNLTSGLLYHDGANLLSTDGINVSSVALPSFVNNETLRLALLYGPAGGDALKVGFYHDTGWTWDSVPRSYGGAFPSDDALFVLPQVAYPANVKELTIYDENRGVAWVEANLTPAGVNLKMLSGDLVSEGWDCRYLGSHVEVHYDGEIFSLSRPILQGCLYGDLPAALGNDINDALQAQGYDCA